MKTTEPNQSLEPRPQLILNVDLGKNMKTLLLFFLLPIFVATSFGSQSIGSGEFVLIEPAAKISPLKDVPGSEKMLDAISIVSIEGTDSRYLILSGRVVSGNTGTPLERISIFFGTQELPRLVAMTNADGEFKFRLPIKTDQRDFEIQVLPDLVGYIYVGGRPIEMPWGAMGLFGGSRRYELKHLIDVGTLAPKK